MPKRLTDERSRVRRGGALSTRISSQAGHYTGQAELPQVIQDTARLLANVVDVVDAATDTVQLKKVADADEMALDTRSTKTVRTRK